MRNSSNTFHPTTAISGEKQTRQNVRKGDGGLGGNPESTGRRSTEKFQRKMDKVKRKPETQRKKSSPK